MDTSRLTRFLALDLLKNQPSFAAQNQSVALGIDHRFLADRGVNWTPLIFD